MTPNHSPSSPQTHKQQHLILRNKRKEGADLPGAEESSDHGGRNPDIDVERRGYGLGEVQPRRGGGDHEPRKGRQDATTIEGAGAAGNDGVKSSEASGDAGFGGDGIDPRGRGTQQVMAQGFGCSRDQKPHRHVTRAKPYGRVSR